MTEKNQTGQGHVDQYTIQLINKNIDGEISDAEKAELDRLLITSPASAQLNEELLAVTRHLDEVREINPPSHLQATIERQVRLPVNAVKNPSRSAAWFGASWFRTGLALAAGVVLTVGVYEMGSGPIPGKDNSSLVGTIAKKANQGSLLDSIQLNTVNLDGQLKLYNNDDLLTLDLKLNSAASTGVVINFADRGLQFDAASSENLVVDNLVSEDGIVSFDSEGEQHFTIGFKRISAEEAPAPLQVSFYADQLLIEEAELIISRY